MATNAYSDGLFPGLAQTIRAAALVPDRDSASAGRACDAILPGGQAVSDSRRILVYYRKSPDGRLVLGGRGRMALPKSASDWAIFSGRCCAFTPRLPASRSKSAGSAAWR